DNRGRVLLNHNRIILAPKQNTRRIYTFLTRPSTVLFAIVFNPSFSVYGNNERSETKGPHFAESRINTEGSAMAQAGQFGIRYNQVVDRLYHALEWRYNEVKDKKGLQREAEILSKMLDLLLADQVGHDVPLHNVEEALHEFQRVRHDSF